MGTTGQKNDFWRGWDIYLDNQNFINMRLINVLPTNLIHVKSTEVVKKDVWTHVTFSYDGSSSANGIIIYIDGKKSNLEIKTVEWVEEVLSIALENPVPGLDLSRTKISRKSENKDIRTH